MISVFGSQIGEDEIARVSEVMRSQWLGFGKQVDLFEAAFSEYRGFEDVVMVDSGSNALFMAVKLLDLPQNSEVILPSFTWVSCAQAVLMAGCIPRFCDVDPVTMNVRAEDIIPHINSKTSAIMVVHYAGLPVDMDQILDLGYPIIEDVAHAVVSNYKGRPCGSIGDVAIFSFDAVKNLAVGEGGAVVARNPEAVARARRLRYCGIGKSGFDSVTTGGNATHRWWEYEISEPFIKMLPTNMAGAIGLGQLEHLDQMQSRRQQIWNKYDHAFQEHDFIVTPQDCGPQDTHSYFTYCVKVPNRDQLAQYLFDLGVYTTLRYHPLHMNKLYGQQQMSLPNCELLNQQALSIPLHPRLSDDEVEKVIESIKNFYS